MPESGVYIADSVPEDNLPGGVFKRCMQVWDTTGHILQFQFLFYLPVVGHWDHLLPTASEALC